MINNVIVEQSVECLAGETEVLKGNLLQCHFVSHKSYHDLTRAQTLAAMVGSWLSW
jgi:hypothetical protein